MPGEPMDEAGAIRFLGHQANARGDERGQYHAYAVELVLEGRVIGDVGVFLHREPDDEGDVGFQFHPDYHGRGYAQEAVRALLRHLFVDLGLRRITSGCDARNEPSYRLMERLGMSRIEDTTLSESRLYALSRDEWLARDPDED